MANFKRILEKDVRSMLTPDRTVPVGGTFVWNGELYRVVARGWWDLPKNVCRGCSFFGDNCPDGYACSCFDRIDKTSVWFVKI